MDLHGQSSDVAEEHVVGLGGPNSGEFRETVSHEVDVFQSAPVDLSAVLEVPHVYSSQSPYVKLVVALFHGLLETDKTSQP